MHHRFELLRCEHLHEQIGVQDVADDQTAAWNSRAVPFREVVECYGIVPVPHEIAQTGAAHIPGAAGEERPHAGPSAYAAPAPTIRSAASARSAARKQATLPGR